MAQRQKTKAEFAPVKRELPVIRPETDEILQQMGALEMKNFILAQAAVFKVDASLLRIPENVGEVVKAAQYTRHYGFMPGVDMHMQSFNSKVKRIHGQTGGEVEVWEQRLALVVGEQAYKKSAQVQANQSRDWIDVEVEVLNDAEAAAYLKRAHPDAERHENDRVARARVLSVQAINMYKALGRKYDPEWSYGVCLWLGAPKVYDGKKSYPKADRDRIPNQRTPEDVAKRRATKSAIMAKYGLVPLDDRTPGQRMAQVMTMAQPEIDDPRAAYLPPAPARGNMDDELDALWESATRRDEPEMEAEPEAEEVDFREVEDNPLLDVGPALSPAHERLHGLGVKVFGEDFDRSGAHEWLVGAYTGKHTPGKVRHEIVELSADEADALADQLESDAKRLAAIWEKQAAKQPA